MAMDTATVDTRPDIMAAAITGVVTPADIAARFSTAILSNNEERRTPGGCNRAPPGFGVLRGLINLTIEDWERMGKLR
jgi:hypothetical protein